MTHKVFCLLSGGVDSTTTLAQARSDFPYSDFEAVTINYGQRHIKERECANIQAQRYGATPVVINCTGLLTGMLVDKGEDNEVIPEKSYAELDPGMSPTYVSFRNGFMLSLLAARAQTWVMEEQKKWQEAFDIDLLRGSGADIGPQPTADIYIGIHADDGVNWAYPDCTPEFFGPMAAAVYVGTYHKVRLRAPLLFDTKPEVVGKGLRLGVDYKNTWSCYVGAEKHCGKCPTCLSRKEAFDLNGVQDPTEYSA
jgi:7-cyano-7-deazaguanine synthase